MPHVTVHVNTSAGKNVRFHQQTGHFFCKTVMRPFSHDPGCGTALIGAFFIEAIDSEG